MSKTTRRLIASAAMAGLLTGTVVTLTGCSTDKAGTESSTSMGKHDCAGKNACKGQGGCKTGDMGCKGKNSCKGKGGCAVK